MPGFMETIQEAWEQPVNTMPSYVSTLNLYIGTTKALKLWKRQNMGNFALRLAIVNKVLLFLDTTQEQRNLTPDKLDFRHTSKRRLMA